MKTRIIIFSLSLAIIGLLLQPSCKKKESTVVEFSGVCYLMSLGVIQFKYTTNHKIEYVLGFDKSKYPMDTVIQYVYDQNDKISRIVYYPGDLPVEFDSILYDASGKVSYCKYYRDGENQGTAAYLYNSIDQLIEVDLTGYYLKHYHTKSPMASAQVMYEYFANGNVSKETVYSGGWIVESNEYEYDAKRNPYREWNLPAGFGTFSMPKLLSKNNYTKEVNYQAYSKFTTTRIVTYTYNSQGYPVSMTFSGDGGGETYGALYDCLN